MSIVAEHFAFVVGVDTHERSNTYAIITTRTGARMDAATFPNSSREVHPPRGSQAIHEPQPTQSADTNSAGLPRAGQGNTYRLFRPSVGPLVRWVWW